MEIEQVTKRFFMVPERAKRNPRLDKRKLVIELGREEYIEVRRRLRQYGRNEREAIYTLLEIAENRKNKEYV